MTGRRPSGRDGRGPKGPRARAPGRDRRPPAVRGRSRPPGDPTAAGDQAGERSEDAAPPERGEPTEDAGAPERAAGPAGERPDATPPAGQAAGPAGRLSDPDLLTGRLFFAVPVPGPARAPLEAVLGDVERLLPRARLTAAGGWHLTLAFLGQVRAELADAVVRVGEAAAAAARPVRLTLEGGGAFPSARRARVLWAGVGGDAEALVELAAALTAACRAAGLRSEERPLVPHLTLARLPEPAPVPPEALDLVISAAAAAPPWQARSLACYRSTLTNRGARYQVVRSFPLGG